MISHSMSTLFDTRRYLSNFHVSRTGHIVTDVLVIGSGVAGARAAIQASTHWDVLLITKGDFPSGCTSGAQGGIACVLDESDSVERHIDDTLRIGAGMNDPQVVERVVRQAPAHIAELIEWGFQADRVDGHVALAREAGHSRDRVVHARGDASGHELTITLERRVRQAPGIRVFEDCFLIDLITHDGACCGAITYHQRYGHQIIWAKQTILSSGGCGRIYRETTNPSGATGDGLAAAYRAGVTLGDLELVQFHPTALYVAGAGRALISEAVRGEGAHLVDRAGHRFMFDYHCDGELAPRDVVSRAIADHLRKTRGNCVFLDARHIRGFAERFPSITRLCADFQLDVARDLIPVRPAAHYMIGGVVADADGLTSLPGLLCCGEAASSGLHGANRLASNSLLEGLVLGAAAGKTAGLRTGQTAQPAAIHNVASDNAASLRTELDLPDVRNSLRSVIWRNVGIERVGERLRETLDIIEFWGHYVLDKTFDEPFAWETQNMLTVARLVAMSALDRTQSVGVHFRTDGEGETGAEDPYHTRIKRQGEETTIDHEIVT